MLSHFVEMFSLLRETIILIFCSIGLKATIAIEEMHLVIMRQLYFSLPNVLTRVFTFLGL